MGRPSRKRPRPLPFAKVENSALQHATTAPSLTVACTTYDSLRSLIHSSNSGSSRSRSSNGAGEGVIDAADEATSTVQHVWGALSEADVATASSALSLGVNVEIDSAGAAWLVNTSTREQRQRRCWERSSSAGALDNSSHDQNTAPSSPQQPISDHHAPASAAAAALDVSSNLAPPSGAPFCACEASLRERLSSAKEEFDEIPAAVFKRVRSACNPAEALGSGSFLNRSAMKLANVDVVVEGLLAQAPGRSRKEGGDEGKTPARGEGETSGPLQFVDLCGGPGGFSEYILRRRRQLGLPSRGWGISLREDGGGRAISGVGPKDKPVDESWDDATSRDEAMMDGKHVDTGDGRFSQNSPVSGGKETGTILFQGEAVAEPVPVAESAAGRSPGRVAEGGRDAHREGRDHVGRDAQQDPCAWRLDHLRPWCDVSVSTAGTGPAPPATQCSGRGDAAKPAVGDSDGAAVGAIGAGTAAAAASTAPPPLLEMRIDYGPKGTGDLTDETNMQGFVDTVLRSTAGRRRPGLVVADGGFGAARDALEQESLVSRLVHCEALAALLLLGEGGMFVCKLFECWTESTAALVYLLHRKFRRIAIVKPITSRPASGERYLVCTGFLPPPPSPPGSCRFTAALRAKVLAQQETTRRRRQRQNCGANPSSSPATAVWNGSWIGGASRRPVVAQAARVVGEVRQGYGPRVGARGVGAGCENDAATDCRVDADVPLGVEAEMKQDESFMSYLRLSNNTLASLQAEACARIVDVASTKRGRAWAFRDSNSSNRGATRGSVGSGSYSKTAAANMRRGLASRAEGVEKGGDDAAAVRCFSQAWGLDGI